MAMEAPPIDPRRSAAVAAVGGALTPVPDATVSPGRETCRLVIEDSSHRELATGWLINSTVVITARHAFRQSSSPRISVSPGFNGGSDPFGTFFSRTFDFADDGSDCAAVFLSQPIDPSRVGAFGFRVARARVPEEVTVNGYIARDSGTDLSQGQGAVLDLDGELKYAVLTESGQSGGPVCSTESPRSVIAIHKDFEVATPITDSLFDQLTRWRQVGAPGAIAPVSAVATAKGGPSSGHASLGMRLAAAINADLGPRLARKPVMMVVADDRSAGQLSFHHECLLSGLVQHLRARVVAPQLRRRLDGPAAGRAATGSTLLVTPNDDTQSAVITLLDAKGVVEWSGVYGVDALHAPPARHDPRRNRRNPRPKRVQARRNRKVR